MNLETYLDYLVDWLKEVKKNSNTKGFILGLSGGIDSALVAALLKRADIENTLCLILPCHSQKEDETDALLVANTFHLKVMKVDLSKTYDQIMQEIESTLDKGIHEKAISLAKVNTKVRLRMTTLYAIGQSLGYLVVGTDNAAEWLTGYFTKYGDGGVDLAPIIGLTKGQVKEASRLLGVPQKIIDRVPSAGLYEGQSDENEMGITYHEIDDYLLGKTLPPERVAIIDRLHKVSEHKRNLALKPKLLNQ